MNVKIITSTNRLWKRYFPKAYKKERLERMTPSERGKEIARVILKNAFGKEDKKDEKSGT